LGIGADEVSLLATALSRLNKEASATNPQAAAVRTDKIFDTRMLEHVTKEQGGGHLASETISRSLLICGIIANISIYVGQALDTYT
jgi:hypothetical protein